MANRNVELPLPDCHLFLAVPPVFLGELISEAAELGSRFPLIYEEITKDQDRAGMAKKQLRWDQKAWMEGRTPALPGLEAETAEPSKATPLHGGRPRMSPEMVLALLVISHYFHSVYSAEAAERLLDSMSVHRLLLEHGLRMPGLRTIGDNVNLLSEQTLQLILRCQLQLALLEGLDDFDEICADSTSCAANTRHPTDSGLMYRLLERVGRNGQELAKFGLPAFREFHTGEWLGTLKSLDFSINVAKTAKERKKLYRKYLKTSAKLIVRFGEEAGRVCGLPQTALLDPIRRMRLDRLWERTVSDLADVCHIHVRCEERVLEGRKLKGTHRVLSTADRAASWIAKGDRVPVVGYKPQIARSPNGLVTALLVPEGNAADAAMLMPLARASIANTGVTPPAGSFDDGYTSAENLLRLNELGIADVSFSGAKGLKLLGEEVYNGETLKELRRNRSAVESLMFCLKHCHEFGQLRRRGMEAVRAELTGKTIVYNLCRIIMLRKGVGIRKSEEQAQAA